MQEQLQQPHVTEDLRKSLTAQLEILQQRQEKKREAVEKLAFLDAELTRIQEQVELLREQSVLSTDPEVVSQRIDQIATTLGGTNQWIRDQQKIYGAMEDLLSDPPPWSFRAQRNRNDSSTTRVGRPDARPFQIRVGLSVFDTRQHF